MYNICDNSLVTLDNNNNNSKTLCVKVVVRLSHPASMELVLRKRLCFSVVKRQSLAEKLKRKLGQVITMIMFWSWCQ